VGASGGTSGEGSLTIAVWKPADKRAGACPRSTVLA